MLLVGHNEEEEEEEGGGGPSEACEAYLVAKRKRGPKNGLWELAGRCLNLQGRARRKWQKKEGCSFYGKQQQRQEL